MAWSKVALDQLLATIMDEESLKALPVPSSVNFRKQKAYLFNSQTFSDSTCTEEFAKSND